MDGRRRVDRLTAEGYLSALEERSLDDIRAMRAESSAEEALLSYERRLLHGRLAIMRAELARREGSAGGSLIEQLPQILADDAHSNRGRFPTNDPDLDFQVPQRRVSRLVSDDALATLPEMTGDEIRSLVSELEDAERDVSALRRAVLDVLDALNAELGRRYASGEADPSDLLRRDS